MSHRSKVGTSAASQPQLGGIEVNGEIALLCAIVLLLYSITRILQVSSVGGFILMDAFSSDWRSFHNQTKHEFVGAVSPKKVSCLLHRVMDTLTHYRTLP